MEKKFDDLTSRRLQVSGSEEKVVTHNLQNFQQT